MLVLSAFLAGLVVFLGVFLLCDRAIPAAARPGASAIGGPFDADRPGRQADHRHGFQGRAVSGVLRLHALSRCLPDHAVRNFGSDARARAGCRRACRAVHHRRSRARHAGGDEGLSVELRSASARRHRRPEAIAAVEKAYRVYAKKVPTGKTATTAWTTPRMVYLMDKQGRFVAPFSLERKPENPPRSCGNICDNHRAISM